MQQVSRHRQVWDRSPHPPGFWNSEFPTEEELKIAREEGQKREAARLKEIAEEAARGNGRWKKRPNT
jgi:DNA repair protein endonuclease SAE2/CtIP C-terminus